jgi:hypothetical protein
MKYLIIFSLFLLKFCSNARAMEQQTFEIVLSSAHDLEKRLNKSGFSDLIQATGIVTTLAGQKRNLFDLPQELTEILNVYSAHRNHDALADSLQKRKRGFIICVVNNLDDIEKLQTAGLLK